MEISKNNIIKLLTTVILSLDLISVCYASSEELSKQATAFYSDNNKIKTIDLILRINEKERSAQDWLLMGNIFSDDGKNEDALYMYKKALEKDKKCYKAYYNIANYYMEIGKFDLAIENYKKAIHIKQDNPYIHYNLACAYLKKNDLNPAKNSLNKAIMYNSKVPDFHYNLAYIYKKQGKEKLAKTYLDNYNKLIEE